MINAFADFFASIAIMLPAFLISLSFHEFFHALTATILGDPTPQKAGRLTLNPIAHIDFIGLLFLLLFRFGWAKPVPFNQNNFKYPKTYSIITALSGPFANFVLALLSFYALKYLPFFHFSLIVEKSFAQIFNASAYINIMLGVFNLLPIPPLDGSHLLMVLFIHKYPKFLFWLYQYSIFILMALFLLPPTRAFFIYLILLAEKLITCLVI